MGLVYKILDLQFYPNLSLFPFAQVSHFHSFILYYLTIFLITFSLSNITSYYRFLIYIYTYIFFLCSLSFFLFVIITSLFSFALPSTYLTIPLLPISSLAHCFLYPDLSVFFPTINCFKVWNLSSDKSQFRPFLFNIYF